MDEVPEKNFDSSKQGGQTGPPSVPAQPWSLGMNCSASLWLHRSSSPVQVLPALGSMH